jgi:hypothetical protein
MAFNWNCPYCNTKTTITGENFSTSEDQMSIENADGLRLLRNEWIVCPNTSCKN